MRAEVEAAGRLAPEHEGEPPAVPGASRIPI